MSLRTVNRTLKIIADVEIQQQIDIERRTGEEFPRHGVVVVANIGDKKHTIGTMESLAAAVSEVERWSQYPNPGRQILGFTNAAFRMEGSEDDDGVGFDF